MSKIIPKIMLAGTVVILGGAGLYFNRPESSASTQATADAYLISDYTNVAPRVAGTVQKVLVREDEHVDAGDLLAILDDRDLALGVTSADAALETIRAQIVQQQALIRQAEANLSANRAATELAKTDAERARKLVNSAISHQSLDQAEAELTTAQANELGSVAALDAARSLLTVYRASERSAAAALASAKLQLEYTKITAPISGTIGQQNLQVGDYVSVGSTAMAIVPLDQLYVRANYRETQLAHVAEGQEVTLSVDALPGVSLKGHVASLGAASNVSYSAIAPANATGNFTKVAQRLPVRITLDRNQSNLDHLRMGMSVVPVIHIEH